MPIFKKSHSDNGGFLISENYRKVLHRCRMVIIKDVDVEAIIDNMAQEDGFKPEVRDYILNFPTREQRTGVFLDKLETRGDRAFGLFMEALREKYKHLAFIMEENIKTINEDNQSQQKERVSISGDTVRKLLANNQRRKLEYSHGSESVDDLDYIFEEKMDDDYIDCYSIPMRGKLQKDQWVKYANTPKSQLEQETDDNTYMGTVSRDLLFRKVAHEAIPDGVRKPPVTCNCFILDRDNKYGLRRPHNFQPRAASSVIERRRSVKEKDSTLLNLPQAPEPPLPKSPNHRSAQDPLPPHPGQVPAEVPPAPPVPPKPGHLPPLSIASSTQKSNDKVVEEEDKETEEPKLPPRTTSASTKPASQPIEENGESSTTNSERTPPLSRPESLSDPPPPPPHKQAPSPVPPQRDFTPDPIPPPVRPRSGSASSPEPTAPPVPPRVNAPVSPEPTLNKPPPPAKADSRAGSQPPEELDDDSFECDESLMSKQIPPPDDTEEDSSAQTITDSNMAEEPDPEEDYEAIGQPPMTMSPPVTLMSPPAMMNPPAMTSPSAPTARTPAPMVNGTTGAKKIEPSRESTPDELENSRHDVSSKASADSLDSSLTPGSIGRSSTTDSGVEALASPHAPFLQTRDSTIKSAMPPPPMVFNAQKHWPDVQILANDDSSDNDSYYEDIDALDEGRSYKGSAAYLDPKSQRSMERGRASIGSAPRSSSMRKHHDDFEMHGHAYLRAGDLVIADKEIVCDIPEPAEEDNEVDVKSEHEQDESKDVVDEAGMEGEIQEEEEVKVHRSPSVKKTVAALEAAAKALTEPAHTEETKVENKKVEIVVEQKAKVTDPYCEYRNTVLTYDKMGRAFYVPQQYLKCHGDPEGEVWFYPLPMSSRQATLFLNMEKQEGCFVVYKPSNPSSEALYNLSLCRANGDVLHYRIIENVHGDVMIKGHDHSFMNVIELVTYFRQNKSQLATRLRRPLKEARMPITPGYHYELKYELNRGSLSLSSNIIGKGNFGVVCAGVYQNNTAVAVKVLQKSDANMQEEDDFIEEAKTMMGLRHDHVLKLIGISCTAKPFFLVTEFVPKGNLKNCLRKQEIATDSIDTLFDVCIQVTSAMAYLESQCFILHRDVAARNFLVAQDLCVKLADFGRARTVSDDNYQADKNEKIAIKWASPEVLVHSSYSTKSDVWALGVTYWEIFSFGEQPFYSLAGEQVAIYVTEGGRLEKPPGCPPDLFNVMKSCWRDNPDERPSFAQLSEKLKSKSSIYYSPPTAAGHVDRASLLRKKPHHPPPLSRDPALPREKTPTTPSLTKKQRQKAATMANSKMRRSATADMKADPTLISLRDDMSVATTRSRERIPTSDSETSLTSTAFEKDDLTRGDKIRKSLRKMISMKPKRKPSNVKDLQNTRRSVPVSSHYDDYGDQY